MYGVLVFVLLVFPLALRNYLKNKEFSFFAKATSILVSFLLFIFFFEGFRIMLWQIFMGDFGKLFTIPEHSYFSRYYYFGVVIIYFFFCLYMSGVLIGVGWGKERSRRRLVFSIPFAWMVLINYFFIKYESAFYEQGDNRLRMVVIIGITIGILSILVFLIFSTKSVKALFNNQPPYIGSAGL